MDRGWVPPGQRGSGSSDARSDTRQMDRFENMSNLSGSWIKVDESRLEELAKEEEKGMEVDDNEEPAKDDDNEELATDEEKGMDQDDKQDREELAKEEEKGQVSP